MKKRAFTLIELIVTLAIISLISSVILIKSGLIPKLQERKEIENLQADINYCREKSLVTGYKYKINIESTIYFSSSNKKYSIIVSPIAGRMRYE